jgi:hypothetical protein
VRLVQTATLDGDVEVAEAEIVEPPILIDQVKVTDKFVESVGSQVLEFLDKF